MTKFQTGDKVRIHRHPGAAPEELIGQSGVLTSWNAERFCGRCELDADHMSVIVYADELDLVDSGE